MALKQQRQKLPSLELLSLPYRRSRGHLENSPQSGVKIKNGSPNFSLSLTIFSRYENIFITHCQCLISQQTRSFESTFISPSPGQEFIPYQLYLKDTYEENNSHLQSGHLWFLLQQDILQEIYGACTT